MSRERSTSFSYLPSNNSMGVKSNILSAGASLEKAIHGENKKMVSKGMHEFKKHLIRLQENLDKDDLELGDQVETLLDELEKANNQRKRDREWKKESLIGFHGLLADIYVKSKKSSSSS